MKTKVFIDGHEGTTGLRIHERLSQRTDIELIPIDDAQRKDPQAIKKCMAAADIAFLCLPDGAAGEAVELAKDCSVRIIDTSTARRVAPGWTYGFPELSAAQAKAIAQSDRVGNPGCHASGVISIVQPLTAAGLMAADYPVSAFSLTGYSGGGKKMIAQYEGDELAVDLQAPRQYGLGQVHKHLKEIVSICHLAQEPIFSPIVDNYYAGMEVTVPIFTKLLKGQPTCKDIWQVYAEHYSQGGLVKVLPFGEDKNGFLAANGKEGFDDMEIIVTGNDERIIVTSIFDNLGKGASGAAIQNMNIMMGIAPETGLHISK